MKPFAGQKVVWIKELFITFLMTVWMTTVWRLFVREPGGQTEIYIGSDMLRFSKEHYFIPLFVVSTFIVAPFLGACSAIRLLRFGEPGSSMRVMGWLLFIAFLAAFLFAGAPYFLNYKR